MNRQAQEWIELLGLQAHPEGGYYKETYRAARTIPGVARACSTAIYYLLPSEEVSTLHRLASDEVFHYYRGSPLTVHVIDPVGDCRALRIGPDPGRGEVLQGVVAAGSWFGATVDEAESFSLVGCTVSPGFDFDDFEQARRDELTRCFPHLGDLIRRLTR